ncbi:MAG TPA: hypothetical protein VME92_13540 [Acetobacteraceae bacterium]|nr:hypothetical protein [Acetobacteraceae bacterium]
MLGLMLSPAFALLSAAVLLGGTLGVLHLRPAGGAPRALGLVHGALAVCGLALLLISLRPTARAEANGTAMLGPDGAVVLAAALLAGLGVLYKLRRGARGAAGLLMALHATLAFMGYVMVAAFWSIR